MKKFKRIMKGIGEVILWSVFILFVFTALISCSAAGEEKIVANQICEYLGFEQHEILDNHNILFSGDEEFMCYNLDGETLIIDLQKEQ